MKPCILFVDDEAPMRDLVAACFQRRGYEMTTAATGEEAMELADRRHFDLAIFDVNLAGENALQLLGYFKSNFPQLPVILYTGLCGEEHLPDQALARGASGILWKTDSLEDLLAAVHSYVPRP